MIHEHHEWLRDVSEQMASDYAKAHAMAAKSADVQRSGHKSESAWVRPLQDWLPPQYQVATRKYILLEDHSHGSTISAETDIVIFHPSYPERLRDRDEVLASGIAAAFSVKNSLGRSGIEEAVKEAATVRRAIKLRSNTVRDEILPPLVYGLLAHSHVWKQPGSNPAANANKALIELDQDHCNHPREGLDFLCIADLGCWSRATTIWKQPEPGTFKSQLFPMGGVRSGFLTDVPTAECNEDNPHVPNADMLQLPPFASLISILLDKLSYHDPSVKPIADGLRVTSPDNELKGSMRHWHLVNALSPEAREQLDSQPWAWDSVYM